MIIPTLTREEAIQNVMASSKPSLVSLGYGGDVESLGEAFKNDIITACGHEDVHFIKAKWRHGASFGARWRRVDLFSSFGRVVFGICNDRAAAYSWSGDRFFNGLIISHWSREQLNAIDLILALQRKEYNSEKDPIRKKEIAERHMRVSFDINTVVHEANNLVRQIDARAEAIRSLYVRDPAAAMADFQALKEQYGDVLSALEQRVFG